MLKDGEDQKKKTYTALCYTPGMTYVSADVQKKLSGIKDLELDQKTPIRVLHRRPNAVRKRTVYEMSTEPIPGTGNEDRFLLKLSTQAGTYIKEFVHGDFGRTSPCLKDLLGCEVDILALDVEVS